jgi:hypothetical protein
VKTARYLAVTLDTQLTWSAHVKQVGKKRPVRRKRCAALEAVHSPYDGLRASVLEVAVRSHVRKLQVLQSKCLRTAPNAPWYIGNKKIRDSLGVLFFADQKTERFYSELADVGNLLFR